MLGRVAEGDLPAKHHVALRSAKGSLRHEECLTRRGFDGPYTIFYHEGRPHAQLAAASTRGFSVPASTPARPLAKRHYKTLELARTGGTPLETRSPLLFNEHVVLGLVSPNADDSTYFVNADADELYFVFQGGGTLHSVFGELPFFEGDYVGVPRGVLHRFAVDPGRAQIWLSIECLGELGLPRHYLNDAGQLRMDAPYCHRDFRRPRFVGPRDEGLRELSVKRSGRFHGFQFERSPFDVVGYDGSVYPWAFPILGFQPRVGQVHLPPTVHGTFATTGALICSFVPRPLDFHPEAIPCPYPHSSVDVDEVIFYCRGEFTSRRGIQPGSISHHPAGIAHGPHPGAYEASLGAKFTDELAVMLDCYAPLQATPVALEIEDAGYQQSFL